MFAPYYKKLMFENIKLFLLADFIYLISHDEKKPSSVLKSEQFLFSVMHLLSAVKLWLILCVILH